MSGQPAFTHAPLGSFPLCVAVHDVAPETWHRCERLMNAVAAVAPVPLSLLIVPNYHRHGDDLPAWYRNALENRRAMGDELVLHGYVHLDEARGPLTPLQWWNRRVLTAGEGEFAALGRHAATGRLRLGLDWFERQGWVSEGFVAPAWLLSPGSWRALEASPLTYTTTADAFHLLHPRHSVRTRCFAYSTRSRGRRALSLGWNGRPSVRTERCPVRLALHPNDCHYAAVITQVQRLLEALLCMRTPMTKSRLAMWLSSGLVATPASTSLG